VTSVHSVTAQSLSKVLWLTDLIDLPYYAGEGSSIQLFLFGPENFSEEGYNPECLRRELDED
jgi:hypothetical protein